MKKIFLLAAALMAGKCGWTQVSNNLYNKMLQGLLSHEAKEISVSEVEAKKDSVVFLDARACEEYEVSCIPGAQWIGYESFDSSRVAGLDKGLTLVVYCSVGYRSEKIALQLESLGFERVYNLYGGIFEWKNQGHEVQTPQGEVTERVHAYSRVWGIWLDAGKKVY